jgi:hypothetical protein
MALLPPNTGGGGSGVSNHGDLYGRDQPNQHPVSAITGLQDWLEQNSDVIAASVALRYFYTFSNTTTQDVILPLTLPHTLSLVIVVVRVSDGAMIEPEISYIYDPGAEKFIERVRLGFTPPITGQYVIHVIR